MITPMNPRVSVVIPTFDRLEPTHEAIASVLGQEHPHLKEIIVVDDASEQPFTYRSGQAAEAPVHVLRHEKNRGAAAARNTGIRAATGSLIAFLDSDDLWCAGKLAAQLSTFDQDPAPMRAIGSGFIKNRGNSVHNPEFWPIGAENPKFFASGCWFCPGSTILVPRAGFERIGYFDEGLRRLEDLDWYLRFALAGGKLDIAPVIGSLIRLSGYPRTDLVAQSVRDFDRIWASRALPPTLRRRLDAYFALEQAAASWRDPRGSADARLVGTMSALFRSFSLVPRFRLHLEQFWGEAPAVAKMPRPEKPESAPRDLQ
ncbi:WcaA Glycosyltransferases involved in cell wall biogenesis [Rhabdaerophilaceae bacterium]